MVVVGIDIGLSGAFAIVMDAQILALEDLPTREKAGKSAFIKREIDGKQLAFRLRMTLGSRLDEAIAVLENVRAMPTRIGRNEKPQGGSSIFAFGETKGRICGVLEALGIEPKMIEPQTWKRWFGLHGSSGRESVEKVVHIFGPDPRVHLVKHHNRAEAALLGRYGWQKFA